jgi:ribosome-binding factor A
MGTRYQKRAADLVQSHLTDLLRTRVNDPRLQMVTITGVDVTPDATRARVYFSVLGGAEEQAEALQVLRSMAGFLRRELGQRIHLRNTPEHVFCWDASIERGDRISSLLDQLLQEDGPTGPEPES